MFPASNAKLLIELVCFALRSLVPRQPVASPHTLIKILSTAADSPAAMNSHRKFNAYDMLDTAIKSAMHEHGPTSELLIPADMARDMGVGVVIYDALHDGDIFLPTGVLRVVNDKKRELPAGEFTAWAKTLAWIGPR